MTVADAEKSESVAIELFTAGVLSVESAMPSPPKMHKWKRLRWYSCYCLIDPRTSYPIFLIRAESKQTSQKGGFPFSVHYLFLWQLQHENKNCSFSFQEQPSQSVSQSKVVSSIKISWSWRTKSRPTKRLSLHTRTHTHSKLTAAASPGQPSSMQLCRVNVSIGWANAYLIVEQDERPLSVLIQDGLDCYSRVWL